MNTWDRRRSAHPAGLVLGAALLWPVIEIGIGGELARRQHPLQVVWLRYAAHLVLLCLLCLPRGGLRSFATRRAGLQLLRGTMMFGMPICFLLAVSAGPAEWVWAVFWGVPLLALLGARVMLGERTSGTAWVTTLVGWVGALTILRPPLGGAASTALALGMAATFAGYLLLSRVLREEPLTASLFYTGVGAVLPTTFLLGGHWTPLGVQDVVRVLALGAASLLFLACLDLALERARLLLVAPLLYGVLVFETALKTVFHAMHPGRPELTGTGLIVAAAVLFLFGRRLVALPANTREDLT